jgi:hypothetical protein
VVVQIPLKLLTRYPGKFAKESLSILRLLTRLLTLEFVQRVGEPPVEFEAHYDDSIVSKRLAVLETM